MSAVAVGVSGGRGELLVASYGLFSSTEVLGRITMGPTIGRAVDAPLPGRAGAMEAWRMFSELFSMDLSVVDKIVRTVAVYAGILLLLRLGAAAISRSCP